MAELRNTNLETNEPIKIAFVVDDIASAIAFYTQVLDLRVEARYSSDAGTGEDFVFLVSESIYVELLPKKAMGEAPIGFHHLAFKSNDVKRHLENLARRGAEVTSEAYYAGVGSITLGDFRGPGEVLLRLFDKGD